MDRYNKVLEEYAKRVMVYPDINSIEDYAYDEVVRTLPFFGQLEKKYYRPNDVYDNPQYVHDFVGYFRGETYAIALVYDFNDGDITDAYPTAGRDDYANSTLILE